MDNYTKEWNKRIVNSDLNPNSPISDISPVWKVGPGNALMEKILTGRTSEKSAP